MALAMGVVAVAVALGFPWPCPLATLARVPCPTCGITRALRSALHGEMAAAFHLHPLWPLVVVAALAFLVLPRPPSWGFPLLVALFVLVWAARFFGAFGGPVPI